MADRALHVYRSLFMGESDAHVLSVDGAAAAWTRSRSRALDDLDGEFRVSGSFADLRHAFYTWLGYHVEEEGVEGWRGFVHDLELRTGRSSRKISYAGIANAIRARYRELLLNGGFEEDGAGPPVFADWSQATTGGSIVGETTNYATGAQAAKLANATGQPYMYQEVAVTAHTWYRLRVSTRGDGSVAGQYSIYDITNAADIVPATGTGVAGTAYNPLEVDFLTPTGCTSIRLYLLAPASAGDAYFDDATLTAINEAGEAIDSYTGWATNAESISRYGRLELLVDAGNVAQAAAEAQCSAELTRLAWPAVSAPEFNERARDQDAEAESPPELLVGVVGYSQTLRFRYSSQDTARINTDAGTLITDALTDDCDWLTARNIGSLGADAQALDDELVGDLIERLLPADYRLLVDKGQGVTIEQIDTATPTLHYSNGRYYLTPGTSDPADPYMQRAGQLVQDQDWAAPGDRYAGIVDNSTLTIAQELRVTGGELEVR